LAGFNAIQAYMCYDLFINRYVTGLIFCRSTTITTWSRTNTWA